VNAPDLEAKSVTKQESDNESVSSEGSDSKTKVTGEMNISLLNCVKSSSVKCSFNIDGEEVQVDSKSIPFTYMDYVFSYRDGVFIVFKKDNLKLSKSFKVD
jgi:hypothetical protein